VQHYLQELVRSFPDLHILISGMQAIAMEAELAEDIKLIRSANEFNNFITALQD